MPSDKEILNQTVTTIKALGEKSKIAIIPREYVMPWLTITTLSYIVIYKPLEIFFGVGYFWLIVIIVWFCTAWTFIAGRQSHNLTDEFYPLPGDDWIDLPTRFVPATDKMFAKKVTQKFQPEVDVDINGNKTKYIPFQNESELHGSMGISLGGQSFTTYLRCNRQAKWSATIPFRLEGLHPQMKEFEIINQSQALSDSLKNLPQGESICLMFGCRSRSSKREQQLSQAIQLELDNPILNLLVESEKIRVNQITQMGLRQEWHHYAFISWSQKNQGIRQQDTISVILNQFQNVFGATFRQLFGLEEHYRRNIYLSLAKDIYNNCFLPWKIRLESRGKLPLFSLDHQQAYKLLFSRINNQTLETRNFPPQTIDVYQSKGQLKHRVCIHNPHSPKDLLSQLIEGYDGRSSCPHHHSRRDRIQTRNDLVGILKLIEPPGQVPFGEQLYWLWSRLKHPSVRDLDVFLEIAPGNDSEARTNLKRLVRQSQSLNVYAKKTNNVVDVEAEEISSEAIAAQKRLLSGSQSLLISLTIHVYRQNDSELDIACQRLVELFSPAKLVREDKVCWKRWLESLPINNQKILNSTQVFSEPRLTMDTESIRSLLPLIRPKDIHSDGVEFVVSDGGYPIYINLVENCQRAIITGMSGSGKTVMAFGHIKQALYRPDRAVVGIDMSNAGEGTLKPITELLGEEGAFINLIDESINLLQPPDLRNLPARIQKIRYKTWLESRIKIITSLVVGQITDPDLIQTATAIVTLTLDIFFKNPQIVRRYNRALEGGWQSLAWQKMPVLEDFLFFCTKDKLGISDASTKQIQALALINTNIRAKIADPNIGECISRPSTVSPHARLQFFGLSGLSDENNAYVLSLVAQGACLNASLQYEKSLAVIDECPALFAKPGFAELVGMQFSLGRKEGVSVLLIGQNIEAVVDSSVGSQILRNTDFFLTGKITNEGATYFHEKFKFPLELIHLNAGDTYGIDKLYKCSNWLVSRGDRHWATKYFASQFELAGLANSPDEKKFREQIMQQYPPTQKGKCQALAKFANSFFSNQHSEL